ELSTDDGIADLGGGLPADGELLAALTRAMTAAASAQAKSRAATSADSDDARAEAAKRSSDRLAEMLERVSAHGRDDALWVDDSPQRLRRVPVDLGERLQMHAWGDSAVVLTSATVSAPMMARLGLGADAEFTDVGSPFDHRSAAMLYVPPLLASAAPRDRAPNNPDWMDEAWKEARALIEAAEGRTLFLCTSMRNARHFAELARDELDWPVFLQGELPKPKLLAEFAADEHRIAVGTMGLWQGVDVAGSSLSLVIVDKLPFPRPDDPLWQARAATARKKLLESGVAESDAGYRAFLEVQVPRAASLLAQGSGRLIRTATDRGVVAVLDPRLAEKAYRKQILGQLPPMRRSRTRSEVIEHLRSGLATP
ncbi:MAG: ATP-dependent DNA helicase, partial [Microthrixaceae bacterium]